MRAVLVGLTASGKKAVGLRVARRLDAEIINLDSMKVYRGMDIGTAKPSPEDRREVPIHLLDLVSPSTPFSAGRFLEEAARAVAAIESKGRRVLFLGGTPFYLHVLVHGLIPGAGPDPALRQALLERAARGEGGALHRELEALDPETARRLHPNDLKRIVRALEVIYTTGTPLSVLHREQTRPLLEGPFRIAGLRRRWEDLEERIARRTRRMLALGLVQEVERILQESGFGPETSRAIGYREILDFLSGACSLEEAERRINTATRRLAKKQWAWYKRFDEIRWFDVVPGSDPEETAERVFRYFEEEG